MCSAGALLHSHRADKSNSPIDFVLRRRAEAYARMDARICTMRKVVVGESLECSSEMHRNTFRPVVKRRLPPTKRVVSDMKEKHVR